MCIIDKRKSERMSVAYANTGKDYKGDVTTSYDSDSIKANKLFANLLLFFICGNIALDFAAGLFGVSSLSQFARIIFFAFMLYVELRLDRKGFCLLFVALTLVAIQSVLSQMLSEEGMTASSLFYDLGIGIKFLMFFTVYFTAKSLIRCNALTVDQIKKAIAIAAIYAPITYLGSVALGLGASSYWDGSGYKSVFSSLNSINVSMIVLFAYSAEAFLFQKKTHWLIPMGLNLISLLMLGTKAGYLFAFAILFYYLMIPPETRLRNAVIGILLLFGLAFVFSHVSALSEMLYKVSSRQTYLFENRSLIDYLTSGRTWMLAEAIDLFASQGNPLSLIFGGGYYCFHHDLASLSGYLMTASVRPVEFDWADLFFSYGAIVTVLVYSFLLVKLLDSWRARKENRFQFIALLGMIIFSCVGGHVLFEAISSVTLGSVLACINGDGDEQ